MKKIKPALCSILLLSLALSGSNLSAQANRGADVPVNELPKELKGLKIKDHFVSTSLKKVGLIHALNGKVVVIHRGTREAYFGVAGDSVYENDSLNTLAHSRCRIKFIDEDVVTMAADTRLAVESFENRRKEGKKGSLFSMIKGKAMFYAMRLFSYKETTFRLKTPTAIVGVRGTKFGAHVYLVEEEKRSDAGIRVADGGNEVGPYLAQAGPGTPAKSFTDVLSMDGVIEVVVEGITNILTPGNMFRGIIGKVIPTPPRVEKAFEEETEVKTEEEMKEEKVVKEEGEGEAVAVTGEETIPDTTQITEDVTNVTQQKTGTQTEEAQPAGPALNHGYFTAMLVQTTGIDPGLEDEFTSSRQAFTLPDGEALSIEDTGPIEDAAVWEGNETAEGGPEGTYTEVDHNGATMYINIATTPIFINALNYLDFGYWSVSQQTFAGSDDFRLVDLAWWLRMQITPDAAMAGFSGSATYEGEAHGTYYQDSPVDFQPLLMHGTFSTNVNFDTGSLNNFLLSVKTPDNSHNVSITGAQGQFNTGSFQSQFEVDEVGGGTWKIDGTAVSKGNIDGSLAGPHGEEMGGSWGVVEYSGPFDKAATGVFAGSKQE
jgi:hypothetical protein